MLQCSQETFVSFFYIISSYFLLLFIFIHFTFVFLAKLFIFFGGNPFYQSNQGVYDQFSDEDIEEQNEDSFDHNSEETRYSTPAIDSSDDDEMEILVNDTNSESNKYVPTSNLFIRNSLQMSPNNIIDTRQCQIRNPILLEKEISQDNKLLVEEHVNFGDTFTIGSTSKDSSEWRSSSINCTEDPFSSSSRRSCPKWESCTVFQKYDEEMMFLDTISQQKLHETETLRSIMVSPRSISERIVHKLRRTRSKKAAEFGQNPYHELESAYVAQICLTWEALNWNYNYFKTRDYDAGCPAYVSQQFQQFQVLLQRYIENEPYEHGRRPEIYARMRIMAPKLLQVPQYRDTDEDDEREEGQISSSRIPSSSFIRIMEESMRTFMNFLKRDKKNKYKILVDLLRISNRRGSSADTRNLVLLLKKINKKKGKAKRGSSNGELVEKKEVESGGGDGDNDGPNRPYSGVKSVENERFE
ncbi:hypothetical protein CASFOL_032299 [Castilleja foliolosa]|uniref:Uncharacterized protein n=1 Tax=Castilleja foliolosa TaxID=1961234 RepID=A0ABD3C122_9LAMI